MKRVLFILLLCCSASICLAQSLGSVTLSEPDTLNFVSNQWPTNFKVQEDPSLSEPQLDVNAQNADGDCWQTPSSLDEILIEKNDGSLHLESLSPKDCSSIANRQTTLSLFLLSVLLLLGVSLSTHNSKLSLACVTLVVILSLAHQSVLSADGPQFSVTLRIPTNHKFKDLTVNLGNGSIDAALDNLDKLEVDSLVIDVCDASDQSSISLEGLHVKTFLKICATHNVRVENIKLVDGNASVELDSLTGSVQVSFADRFSGNYEVVASDITLFENDHCSADDGSTDVEKMGACSGEDTHTLTVVAGVTATVYFDEADLVAQTTQPTTTTTNNSGPTSSCDPEPSNTAPNSASVSSSWTIPGLTYRFNDPDQFWLTNIWSSPDEQDEKFVFRTTNTNGEYEIYVDGWGSDDIYVVLKEGEFSDTLVKDARYEFSFEFESDSANEYNAAEPPRSGYAFDVVFATQMKDDEIWKWNEDPLVGEGCGHQCDMVHLYQTTGNAAATTYQTDFTPDRNYLTSQFYIHVLLPGQPKPNPDLPESQQANGGHYWLRNIRLVRKDQPREIGKTPSRYHLLSSLEVPRPTLLEEEKSAMDSQSNCPHWDSGLVDWHDASTWPNGQVPRADGSYITLPANKRVLLSACSIKDDMATEGAYFGTIEVPLGSELVFNDADMDLRVGNIIVHGHLKMGSPTCRLHSKITITFDDQAEDMGQGLGRKGVGVTGSIDIFGKLFHHTWTRLAASAQLGDDRILLQEDVNWEVGQQVLVVTTIWYDTPELHQNEVRTIKAIDGRRVQFTQPLKYFHYAGEEYQAEVALLSRNIVLQGDEKSEDKQFGGHLLMRGNHGRIAGVRAYRMGQINRLARYPIHFHMMDTAETSYITDCAVQHSFYRAYTIHGTHRTLVSRNVAFDITGHAYYVEDGVEEDNTISFNLAAHIHPILPNPPNEIDFNANGGSQAGITVRQNDNILIPADIAAGGFYVTNANNKLIGNTASGGFAGFSYVNLPEPIGNHRQLAEEFNPMERPLAQFYGNFAHSCGWQWSRAAGFYFGGMLWHNNGEEKLTYNVGRVSRDTQTSDENGERVPLWMVFEHNRVALTRRGLNHWGERAEIHHFEAHDVTRGSTTFGESWVNNALFNLHSKNPAADDHPAGQAFQFYDISVKTILTNTEFRNIYYTESDNPHRGNYGIISLTHSDKFKPQGISATKGITYNNVWDGGEIGHYSRQTGASRQYNFIDWDGSATYRDGPTIVGSGDDEYYSPEDETSMRIRNWWHVGNCDYSQKWKLWLCEKTDDREIASIYFDMIGLTNGDNWKEYAPDPKHYVGTVSHFGRSGDDRRSLIVTRNPGVTGLTGDHGWYFHFDLGSPQEFDIVTRQIPLSINNVKTHLVLAVRYPDNAQFTISVDGRWRQSLNADVTQANSLQAMLDNEDGLEYYFDTSANDGFGYLYLKVIDRYYDEDDKAYFERGGVVIYDAYSPYKYQVRVECSGCSTTSFGGKTYYTGITDVVPPFL